jgi:hypothetical protein
LVLEYGVAEGGADGVVALGYAVDEGYGVEEGVALGYGFVAEG